jgi:hypothetical protein
MMKDSNAQVRVAHQLLRSVDARGAIHTGVAISVFISPITANLWQHWSTVNNTIAGAARKSEEARRAWRLNGCLISN